jgi:hypothetical protein
VLLQVSGAKELRQVVGTRALAEARETGSRVDVCLPELRKRLAERRASVALQVPEQHHPPAWAQDARELAPRLPVVEPVKGVPNDDQVDAVVRQGGRLRRPAHGGEVGVAPQVPHRHLAHSGVWLDGNDPVPMLQEQRAELPRAGADVGDAMRGVVRSCPAPAIRPTCTCCDSSREAEGTMDLVDRLGYTALGVGLRPD